MGTLFIRDEITQEMHINSYKSLDEWSNKHLLVNVYI